MVAVATRLGLLAPAGDRCELTPRGEELSEVLCYFTCTVGGYGELLLEMAGLTRGEKRVGVEVRPRFDQVAKGRQQYSRGYELAALERMLGGIEARTIADLGSGDGSFLLFACGRDERPIGFGIDVDGNACARARSRLAAAGLGERTTIVQGSIDDVLGDVAAHPGLAGADLVTSFALLHHMFAAPDGPAGFLRRVRAAFPRATHFLFSDITAMTDDQREGAIPIFSLAYELFHPFMDVEILGHHAYMDAFREAGLRVVRHTGFGQPNDQLYLLAPA
jgi:hypothetical protein